MNVTHFSVRRAAFARVVSLCLACGSAQAHDGHGLGAGGHWHATDAVGYLLAGVAAAYGLWAWWRGRR